MNIKFDLDGVCREIHKPLEILYSFKIKHWSFIYKGKDFWDMINEHSEIWLNALPTEYYDIIKKQENLEFWSVQKTEYKADTIKWLDKYFPKYKIRFFKNFEQKEKAVYKNNIILIDDFPNFSNYKNIILIDRTYNKNTKANVRIKTPEKLQKYLSLLK
jgi:hypothetical protein